MSSFGCGSLCSLYALNTYSSTLSLLRFNCKTTLRDQKVNIQAPCGGTRDPYFMRFQRSPPFSAGYTFCITALSLSRSLFVLLCHIVEEICMFQTCSGRAAGLFYRSMARFESPLKATRRNMAEKPAPLPTVNVHVGHGNVGEPHNGCHDGPARCTAIGGIRWSKFPYMCLRASYRLLVELLDVCACSELGL